MNVLGISCFFHDSAAALVCNGHVAAAAEEERFTRIKHYNGFPEQAIAYCLREVGLSRHDLDYVAFYERPTRKYARVIASIADGWPRSFRSWTHAVPSMMGPKLGVRGLLARVGGDRTKVVLCDHHMAHAASAFFSSGFDRAAVLVADGVGEWETTSWGIGEGNALRFVETLTFPHSLGLFYSALTAYLGFRVNDAEWKVMGLAAYGRVVYKRQFESMVEVREDGSFRLRPEFFSWHSSGSLATDAWCKLLGRPPRRRGEPLDDFHNDVAASGQRLVEEVIVRIGAHIRARTTLNRICVAGGVGLNSVANWRLMQDAGFDDIFIQPAAGDAGAALGAALHVSHARRGVKRSERMSHAYLGPEFPDQGVRAELDEAGVIYESCASDRVLIEQAADAIAAGKVVGWFQGRMEFGPRALGARSILADPRHAEMKDAINAKVKFRESFRPFAPAVLHDEAHRFFEMPRGMHAPFMLLVPQVRPEMRARIPAVTHADGSARVQTVTRESNPLYYDLIAAVGRRTGIPIVINTSFNVRGEPIVCTPKDALKTFSHSGLDALFMGRYVVSKNEKTTTDVAKGAARSDALENPELRLL